jgi:hypothetical protein
VELLHHAHALRVREACSGAAGSGRGGETGAKAGVRRSKAASPAPAYVDATRPRGQVACQPSPRARTHAPV